MASLKTLKHRLEAAAMQMLFWSLRQLPLDMSSRLGGFMARSIGPFMRAHKIAQKNLSMVYPQMTFAQQRALIMDMWDNLGRVAAELAWLPDRRLAERLTVNGLENVPRDRPVIFFSAHMGNWELTNPLLHNAGIPTTLVYREANNPYADKIISDLRATHAAYMLQKGGRGAVKMVRTIKSGQSIAMLVDQKMNEGISVPFFGRDAMTAPAIAELALRYDMPIIPGRVLRTQGCHFEARIEPPLVFEKTGDTEKDVLTIMTMINQRLEAWIREHPEQWFWVHQRWPKEPVV